MSDTAVQVVPPLAPPGKIKSKKVKKTDISVVQASNDIKESGFTKLDAKKLRFRAKVGRFIEQEGEHHISRAMLARNFADLEEKQATCEEMLAKYSENKECEEYGYWMKISITLIEQMNRAAQHLNQTRRKIDPTDMPAAFKVPTMPARTVITNNTQNIFHTPKTE